jgi:hypothetical protein
VENSNTGALKIPEEDREWGRNCFPKPTKVIKP